MGNHLASLRNRDIFVVSLGQVVAGSILIMFNYSVSNQVIAMYARINCTRDP